MIISWQCLAFPRNQFYLNYVMFFRSNKEVSLERPVRLSLSQFKFYKYPIPYQARDSRKLLAMSVHFFALTSLHSLINWKLRYSIEFCQNFTLFTIALWFHKSFHVFVSAKTKSSINSTASGVVYHQDMDRADFNRERVHIICVLGATHDQRSDEFKYAILRIGDGEAAPNALGGMLADVADIW